MPKIAICASMRFKPQIKQAMQTLNEHGLEALFPNLDFVEDNPTLEITAEIKKRLADAHFEAIQESDAVYFITQEGYMGTSVKLELGYSYALQKPIYFSQLTGDDSLDTYPQDIIALNELAKFKDIL